jgi:hypothetical protein
MRKLQGSLTVSCRVFPWWHFAVGARRLGALAAVLVLPALAAQGTVSGTVTAQGVAVAARVGVVALPEQAHPFNEITAGTWQQAFTAFSEGRQADTPFGSLDESIAPLGTWFADADADGRFRISGLPLEARLGLAARVDGLWWPLRRELWLTPEAPSVEVGPAAYRLGDEPQSLVIAEHHLEAAAQLRPDLKYGGVSLIETLRLENSIRDHAVLIDITIEVAVVPGVPPARLPSLYGSQLLHLQAVKGPRPEVQENAMLARQAWRFGGGDAMHGGAAHYGRGPQASADNWHPLNDEPPLAVLGAGDTLFRVSEAGRAALVFRRPVPPATEDGPGVLIIRVFHRGGVPSLTPEAGFTLERSFAYPLLRASARVQSLVELRPAGDSPLWGQPTLVSPHGDGTQWLEFPALETEQPVLAAGDALVLRLGLDPQARAQLRAFEQTTPAAQTGAFERRLNRSALFLGLALAFGVAFAVALVGVLRKPREEQVLRLSRPPGSRAELLKALKELESDYAGGRLPATAYAEERRRLLNRLIELDGRKSDGP